MGIWKAISILQKIIVQIDDFDWFDPTINP